MFRYFPFQRVREFQKDLMRDVWESIERGENLIAHAPTGLGKTVASLVPAIEFAERKGLDIFFLTPKHTQHRIAVETLRKIKEKGAGIKAIDIIGKKWLCNFQGLEKLDQNDFAELCSYLKKEEKCPYYNKLFRNGELSKEAILKIKKLGNSISHAEEAKSICKDLCAYELICYAARDANVVVCDYYHIFNPHISKSFLFKIDKSLEDSILIIDEAHLLPTRVRDLLSVYLTTKSIRNARKEAKVLGYEEAEESLRILEKLLREQGEKVLSSNNENFLEVERLEEIFKESFGNIKEGMELLREVSYYIKEKKKKSFCSGIARFMESFLEINDAFSLIIKRKEDNIVIKQQCLDASIVTKEIFEKCYASILMSATLEPTSMYKDLLGIEKAKERKYISPFPKENKLCIITPLVTSRYSKRREGEYRKFAEYISKIAKEVPGNIAVFFPSYEFRDRVWDFLETERKVLIEERKMSKEKKSNLIKTLENGNDYLLLAVQGGSFSEGVDFPNNCLKGIIIAGLGLAKPDLETKSLIEYYDKKFGKGWNYAYCYPAIQKAIQASGRAIRSEKDKAVILFLDERFLWKNYRDFLKSENFIISAGPWNEVRKFFANK